MKFFILFPLWALLAGHLYVTPTTALKSPTPPQKVATTTKSVAVAKAVAKPAPKPAVKNVATTTPAAPVTKATLTPATPIVSEFASQVEQAVFDKVNIERSNNGLTALKFDATLADIARSHSNDMLTNNYFNHTNLSGCSTSCRITNAGYSWRGVGENIYMMSGYKLSADATAEKIVQGWMNSPGHRANILSHTFTHQGIGVYSEGSKVYATQNFATPR